MLECHQPRACADSSYLLPDRSHARSRVGGWIEGGGHFPWRCSSKNMIRQTADLSHRVLVANRSSRRVERNTQLAPHIRLDKIAQRDQVFRFQVIRVYVGRVATLRIPFVIV